MKKRLLIVVLLISLSLLLVSCQGPLVGKAVGVDCSVDPAICDTLNHEVCFSGTGTCQIDTDSDGILDCGADLICSDDVLTTTVDESLDDDLDKDNDGVMDEFDAFDFDAAASEDFDNDLSPDSLVVGVMSTSVPPLVEDTDDDNDGVLDINDIDPLDNRRCEDIDNDTCDDCALGVDSLFDLPDNTPLNDSLLDTDFILSSPPDGLCDSGDTDDDDDTILDAADNCPFTPNTNQDDFDSDGKGDACDEDYDGDGILDDGAGDGVTLTRCTNGGTTLCDDNCPLLPNADQADYDGDLEGDACDADDDNDGVDDVTTIVVNGNDVEVPRDLCPRGVIAFDYANNDNDNDGCMDHNEVDAGGNVLRTAEDTDDDNDDLDDFEEDLNRDGVYAGTRETDYLDADTDADGFCDGSVDVGTYCDAGDAFPLISTEHVDTDHDGTGDDADPDADNDGVLDSADICPLQATNGAFTNGCPLKCGDGYVMGSEIELSADGNAVFDLNKYGIEHTYSDGTLSLVADIQDEAKTLLFSSLVSGNYVLRTGVSYTNRKLTLSPTYFTEYGFAVEQCDDGNSANGDGCSTACRIETNYSCGATTADPAIVWDCALMDDSGQDFDSDNFFNCGDDWDCDLTPESDQVDNCLFVSNANQLDTDSDGIGDTCDVDDDNDGVLDTPDNCELKANPGQEDVDGNGIGDACAVDRDGDNVPDCGADGFCTDLISTTVNEQTDNDNCPLIFNSDQVDTDSDGLGNVCDADVDGDGQSNAVDTDDDNDGVVDQLDLCDFVPDAAGQNDADGDGIGDACESFDVDNDNKIGDDDNCPDIANTDQRDQDNDRVGDVCDNCVSVSNAPSDCDADSATPDEQCDSDVNAQGVVVGDGIGDACDVCPRLPGSDQGDSDQDGIGNSCDNCPLASNTGQEDLDLDYTGDACDAQLDDFALIVQELETMDTIRDRVRMLGLVSHLAWKQIR